MSRIRTSAVLALAAVAATIAAAIVFLRSPVGPAFHGTDLGPGVPAPAVTLLSGDSARVSLDDFRGRAVLLFFGYTTCPDVCPLTMGKLRRVMERLGEERPAVQVVLITVDPDLDTPADIHAYARRYDPAFIGLGGERDALQAVARDFGVYASEPSAPARRLEGHEEHGDERDHGLPPRLIAHSSYLFGITPEGELRLLWSEEATVDEIAGDVRALLES